jgi:pyruvate,water dikinase
MTWVVSLADRAALDPTVAGGKGAGLARLARASLPTLPGLVVTAAAFRAGGGRAPGRVAGLAEAVRARLTPLGRGPFAVRSSAVAEDGPGASWAGVLDTRLGVPAAGVLRAVGAVWRSAHGARARAYAGRRAPELAVVIQPLAPAAAAGNCFTASPKAARVPLLVIEAVAGLGAPLAGGTLTPDRYLVDRATGVVLDVRLAVQPWRLAPGPQGLVRARRAREAAPAPKLPLAVVRRVARLALAAERRLGGPQDVEWVWTGEQVALLQARPLTV